MPSATELNAGQVSPWFRFWSRPPGIHVGERHLQARYRVTMDNLLSTFPDIRGKRVLDYGCGEALDARRLAAAGAEALLYDRSEYFRNRVQSRYARDAGIRVLDEPSFAALPGGSVDLMLVCSVIQYLDARELDLLIDLGKHLLKPGGVLILADILPKSLDTLSDVIDFMSYSARHGFFLSGLRTLIDMATSNYRAQFRDSQLAHYDLGELSALLRRHGLEPTAIPTNIGISRARRTLLARKPA